MKRFTNLLALFIFVLCCIFSSNAKAQVYNTDTVLNPADPIVIYNAGAPPTDTTPGIIKRWVKSNKLDWNTSSWKAYYYKGVCFRLKFPKTYNRTANDGKKYPMLVFWHGLGEAGPLTDNEYQLYHGGQFFTSSVDNGTFDGYVIAMQSQGFFGGGHYAFMKEIIDYMAKVNKLDPFQVTVNGLSAGGQASWDFMQQYPAYVSASLPMSWTSYFYGDPSWVNILKFTPIWNFQGAADGAPTPYTSREVRDKFLAAGGNYKYTEYPNLGHGTWNTVWTEPDFWPYQLRSYAANPWPLNGRREFCPTETISTTIGVAPNFAAYEWRKNGTVVQTGTQNTLAVNSIGTYDVRVRQGTLWSEWSRIPVVIAIKGVTQTPSIKVSGLASRVLPALDGSNSVKLELPDGYASYAWEKEGSPATLGTTRFLTALTVGNYKAKVTEAFGCASDYSPLFTVVDANGPNKPDAAVNVVATTVSQTSIKLTWSDNPSPQFNEVNFEVYKATQSGGPYTLAALTAADVKMTTLTGLDQNTKYYFKVRAVNNTGAATPSAEVQGTTLIDTESPTAPQNLTIIGTTRNTISVIWDRSFDNVGVVRYDIYVNGVKTFATTEPEFIISGLTYPNPYTVSVRAVDLAGNQSAHSGQASGRAILGGLNYKYYVLDGSPTILPDFSNLFPRSRGLQKNISIAPRTQDVNVAFLWEGYIRIPKNGTYRLATASDDGSKIWLGALNAIGSPYTYSGASTVNNDGSHATQAAASGDLALQAGVYPIAIAFYQGGGGFSMNAYWQTTVNGAWSAIPDSVFTDNPGAGGAIPAAPSALTATAASYKQINLTFTDNSTNETYFEIWRSTNAVTGFTTIDRIPAVNGSGVRNYNDANNLIPNTKYYYRIRAVNDNGESAFDRDGQGVYFKYYEVANINALPDFESQAMKDALKKTGRVSNFNLSPALVSDNYQLRDSGTINIPTPGVYTFFTSSDDGSKLYIDDVEVVNNDGTHPEQERSGSRNLTAGPHKIIVTFFEKDGGEVLTVKIAGVGLAKQTIPDAWLGNALVSATTQTNPNAPAQATNVVATAQSKSTIGVTWTDNANNELKYEVYRSSVDNSAYMLYATLPANATSFTDNGLFANSVYYYRIRTVAETSAVISAEDSSKTWNTAPVIQAMPATRSARTGIVTVLTIKATDADGDPLTFTGTGLPGFATLVNATSNTATLTLNSPAAGTYNNLKITASDQNGGSSFTQFNLVVNNNFDPVIAAISNYSIIENEQIVIPLSATDGNGNTMAWSVNGLPNEYSLTPGANGSASLTVKPTYASSGSYTVTVSVLDGNNGVASREFTINVADKNPNSTVYVRVLGTNPIGFPWNAVSSLTTNNFVDDKGNTTSIGLTFPYGLNGGNAGATTGNNSGVYPDAVLRDYYVFGASWMPYMGGVTVTGLNSSNKYSLTLLGSSVWDYDSDNGETNYTVNGVTKSLYVQNNTQNTVTFKDISPDANGTITVTMTKGVGASAGYMNSIVISSSFDDGSTPLAPVSLQAQNEVGKGARLSWQNVAYNDAGYQIYRSTNANTGFNLVGTAEGADIDNYLDGSVSGNTTYYYKIRAVSPGGLTSDYSNVASVLTLNRIPSINVINNVTLRNNQTTTVTVTAVDDPSDPLTFTATGLPHFATFNPATGVISIAPLLSSVGVYKNITVKVTDASGASHSRSFTITVTDKDMRGIYLSFSDGNIAESPWNNLRSAPNAGVTYTGLKDDRDSVWTSLSVNLQNGFSGQGTIGMRTGNNAGIYPEGVIQSGMYSLNATTRTVVVGGLNSALKYNFVFFASHEDGTNGNTNYTIGGVTVRLQAAYNIDTTAQINGVSPDGSGNVTITISAAAGNTNLTYLNAMVIQSYTNTATTFNAPTNLRAVGKKRTAVTLRWEDRSDNETGFSIYRASASNGSYNFVASVGANVTTYTNTNLTPNQTYYYIVRADKASSPTTSVFSNVAKITTYAYAVYINFSKDYQSTSPWNNTARVPQKGATFNTLYDETNALTSLRLEVTSLWDGLYGGGMTTGNNSGVVPDNVMLESYGLFPGGVATVKIKGLNLSMKYDLTFFGSANGAGDFTTAYKVNGKTVLLNAAQNRSGTVTMYDVVPDANGEVTITTMPGTPYAQFGLLGAAIIQGYNENNNTIPAPANRSDAAPVVTIDRNADPIRITKEIGVTAYPNPFNQYFTLTVTTENPDRLDVVLFDVNGKLAYQTRANNLNSGVNVIRVQPDKVLPPGTYFVKAILGSRVEVKMIKVVKQ